MAEPALKVKTHALGRAVAPVPPDDSAAISRHAAALAGQLKAMSEALFRPESEKSLRRFTSGEAASWIGVSDSRLRQLALAGEGPALLRRRSGLRRRVDIP